MSIDTQLEKMLRKVEKPARYTGGEVNSAKKDPEQVSVRFGFAFPDTYEIGMSYMGMQILYNILKHLSEEENATHPSVKAAASFIEKNYANHTLTNEMIAESIGISEVYLRKLFLNFLKTSPKQYVTDVRINHAKQLLTENLYSVSEIADMCGYTNIYHFSKRFKGSVNLTPSEYKAAFFKTPSEL